MATIAIDFGTARTKIATFDAAQGKPVLIELGREVRSVILSLVYIPAEGPVLVGDDAQEEILRDPAGAVRGLKKEIHKQDAILRNGRKFSPGDLLTALFARIKQDCQQFYFRGEEVSDCCLTVPVNFDQHRRDCISQAASRAGFANITVEEEPVAAAAHWLSQNSKDIQCVVVCDIGAGTTDIAMLRRDGDQLRPHPGISTSGFNKGGDDIDDQVWESLQAHGEPIEHADSIKLQLRKIKERFTRRAVQEDRLNLGRTSLAVQRPIVEKCFEQFTQQVLGELRRLAGSMKKAGVQSAPLVLAGGGANIPGLEAAIRNDKWPGEVFHWNDSEYASVLGAVGIVAIKANSSGGVQPTANLQPPHSPKLDQSVAGDPAFIQTKCPECQREMRVPFESTGTKIKCPRCGTKFTADQGIGHRLMCEKCNGSGRCKKCKGKGTTLREKFFSSVPDVKIECPRCSGDGACRKCNGVGWE